MTDAPRDVPPPGSFEAVAQGCECPVLDNGRGRGYMGGAKDAEGNTIFVINCDCPLHAASGTKGGGYGKAD